MNLRQLLIISLQALLKHRQRFSVITRVKKHHPDLIAEAYRFERYLMNLALLPSEVIEEAFEELTRDLKSNDALFEIMGLFFDYYWTTWILGIRPDTYSVYRLARRTNNVLERYHRMLKAVMASKPEVGKFLGMYNVCFVSGFSLFTFNPGTKNTVM